MVGAMSKVDLYAQDLKRRLARTRLERRSPAGQVERLRPGGELVAAEPVEPAGGNPEPGAQTTGELLARLRRVLGDVELVADTVNPVNTVNEGKV